MKYRVEVAWITKEVSYATIEVEAGDEREAEKLALGKQLMNTHGRL